MEYFQTSSMTNPKEKKKLYMKGLMLHYCAWNNFRLWHSLVHAFLAQLV